MLFLMLMWALMLTGAFLLIIGVPMSFSELGLSRIGMLISAAGFLLLISGLIIQRVNWGS